MKVGAFIKKYTMVLALVLVFVLFTILTGGRLVYSQNISNLLLQNAYVLIMACGMLLCILTGGNVDLSVGSTLCLSAALAAKIMDVGGGAGTAILVAMLVSCAIGIWQGWLIGYIHIPPFICTLAGMFLFRGIARVILDSRTIAIMDNGFLNLFTSYIQIPGVDTNKHCVSALVVGIIIAVGLTVYMILDRTKKEKQGYEVSSMGSTIAKAAIFDVLIVAYSSRLMGYKGIPVMVIWILAVVLIFAFLTSQTVFGRHFYAVGGNEKWQASPVFSSVQESVLSTETWAIPMKWTLSHPASSAVLLHTAVPERCPASWSALFCLASLTWVCPFLAFPISSSISSRAQCFLQPSSSMSSPITRQENHERRGKKSSDGAESAYSGGRVSCLSGIADLAGEGQHNAYRGLSLLSGGRRRLWYLGYFEVQERRRIRRRGRVGLKGTSIRYFQTDPGYDGAGSSSEVRSSSGAQELQRNHGPDPGESPFGGSSRGCRKLGGRRCSHETDECEKRGGPL